MSIPNPVAKTLQIDATAGMMRRDRELLHGLAAAGSKIDSGLDGAGLFMRYLSRGGGYYIDTGASQLIVDGGINIAQGQEVNAVQAHSHLLADGSAIEADEIVFATGYQSMRETARKIFGDGFADTVNHVWGFDTEGENQDYVFKKWTSGLLVCGGAI